MKFLKDSIDINICIGPIIIFYNKLDGVKGGGLITLPGKVKLWAEFP